MKRSLLCTLILFLFGATITRAQVEEPTILNPITKWKFKTQGPIRGSSVAATRILILEALTGICMRSIRIMASWFGNSKLRVQSAAHLHYRARWCLLPAITIPCKQSTKARANWFGNIRCRPQSHPIGSGTIIQHLPWWKVDAFTLDRATLTFMRYQWTESYFGNTRRMAESGRRPL